LGIKKKDFDFNKLLIHLANSTGELRKIPEPGTKYISVSTNTEQRRGRDRERSRRKRQEKSERQRERERERER